MAVAAPEELTGRSLADLHALARDHGIRRYRLLRKEELVEALGGAPAPIPTAVPGPEREPAVREVRVNEVRDASVDVLDVLQRLVGELSSSAPKPHAAELEEIIASPVTRLLVARDESDEVVGMLTLVLFRIPTGMRAWIEDVVVDQRARARSISLRTAAAKPRTACTASSASAGAIRRSTGSTRPRRLIRDPRAPGGARIELGEDAGRSPCW